MPGGKLLIELSPESPRGAYRHRKPYIVAPLGLNVFSHAGNIGPASEPKGVLVGIHGASGDE
jgi:hypothetical protein